MTHHNRQARLLVLSANVTSCRCWRRTVASYLAIFFGAVLAPITGQAGGSAFELLGAHSMELHSPTAVRSAHLVWVSQPYHDHNDAFEEMGCISLT